MVVVGVCGLSFVFRYMFERWIGMKVVYVCFNWLLQQVMRFSWKVLLRVVGWSEQFDFFFLIVLFVVFSVMVVWVKFWLGFVWILERGWKVGLQLMLILVNLLYYVCVLGNWGFIKEFILLVIVGFFEILILMRFVQCFVYLLEFLDIELMVKWDQLGDLIVVFVFVSFKLRMILIL